ncbi:MAG: type II toxin-antitoxin system VapC family toxin [Desulfobulbus sp.]|nr:type II toxin-antitoxin system VapC family toxin [Desulfobulbus sp.]
MAAADFVLDNSVAMRWALPDSNSPAVHAYADDVLGRLEGGETALVPNLWYVEAVSVLVRAEKKGWIREAQTNGFLVFTNALEIEKDDSTAASAVAALVRTHGLSGYDAVYLDLALRSGLPLATVDEDLSRAAKALGVSLYLGGPG